MLFNGLVINAGFTRLISPRSWSGVGCMKGRCNLFSCYLVSMMQLGSHSRNMRKRLYAWGLLIFNYQNPIYYPDIRTIGSKISRYPTLWLEVCQDQPLACSMECATYHLVAVVCWWFWHSRQFGTKVWPLWVESVTSKTMDGCDCMICPAPSQTLYSVLSYLEMLPQIILHVIRSPLDPYLAFTLLLLQCISSRIYFR